MKNSVEESGTRGGWGGNKAMALDVGFQHISHVLATVAMQSTLFDGSMCTTSEWLLRGRDRDKEFSLQRQ